MRFIKLFKEIKITKIVLRSAKIELKDNIYEEQVVNSDHNFPPNSK